MPWLTPDNAVVPVRCYRVYIPENEELEAAYCGALLDLERVGNWQEIGENTPEEIAAVWSEVNLLNMQLIPVVPIGTIIWGGWSTVPDGWLQCNGAEYDKADYPDLYAAIGDTFGATDDTFFVPDLRAKFAVGNGYLDPVQDYPIGSTGGEARHRLATDELPPHRHTTHSHITTLAAEPGEVVVSSPSTLTENTSYTGGNNYHENRPPYLSLFPAISYR